MNQGKTLVIDIVVQGQKMRIDGQTREAFAKEYGLDKLIPNRYSEILIVDLIVNLMMNGIDPRRIIDEIKRLETIDSDGFTKEASQFKHAPLHPLWHQHYFSDHFVFKNIQNEMQRSFKEIWDKSMGAEGSIITKEQIENFVHNLVVGSIETRSDEKRVTGEWLVFSKEPHGNLYLCMATHDTGDQVIYDQIAYCCEQQFPTLEPFLSNRTSK